MNILTFDIEEWFHLLDNESTKGEEQWLGFEPRIHKNVDRLLEIIDENNVKATFFCMGWIARKYPEVIRKIAERYEVASHTDMHQLVYEQGEKAFREDVSSSIKLLEDITGKKVRSFRAPGFSITENEKWAFEVLVENGIEIDCSVFPAPRAHGGFPSYSTPKPSIISYNGIEIKELPISYSTFLGQPIVFSGGGYFRLFPYWLIKHWTRRSDYLMSYLHPRDFDPDQPIIQDLSRVRRFKSYVGLKTAEAKLRRWLNDFDFIDVAEANERINWEETERIVLS